MPDALDLAGRFAIDYRIGRADNIGTKPWLPGFARFSGSPCSDVKATENGSYPAATNYDAGKPDRR